MIRSSSFVREHESRTTNHGRLVGRHATNNEGRSTGRFSSPIPSSASGERQRRKDHIGQWRARGNGGVRLHASPPILMKKARHLFGCRAPYLRCHSERACERRLSCRHDNLHLRPGSQQTPTPATARRPTRSLGSWRRPLVRPVQRSDDLLLPKRCEWTKPTAHDRSLRAVARDDHPTVGSRYGARNTLIGVVTVQESGPREPVSAWVSAW